MVIDVVDLFKCYCLLNYEIWCILLERPMSMCIVVTDRVTLWTRSGFRQNREINLGDKTKHKHSEPSIGHVSEYNTLCKLTPIGQNLGKVPLKIWLYFASSFLKIDKSVHVGLIKSLIIILLKISFKSIVKNWFLCINMRYIWQITCYCKWIKFLTESINMFFDIRYND